MSNPSPTKATPQRIARAAKAVVGSELHSLRHRVADGYAVVAAALLDKLKAAYEAEEKKDG